MINMAREYFEPMFTTDPNVDPLEVLHLFQARVNDAMNKKNVFPFHRQGDW